MRNLLHQARAVTRTGSRSHLIRVGAALVAAVGVVTAAAAAGAITPGEPFTVDPDEGGPFTVVSVSGANCTEGPSPSVDGVVVGPPEIGVVAAFVATPDANGDWATTFTVAPNTPPGPYEVTATCRTDPNEIDGDDYGSQPFTVLEGELAIMTVSPLSAEAGQDVTVTVSGTLCRGEDATVDVEIFEESSDPDEFVVRTTVTPDAEGDWTIELTIPASAPPGTYGVGAICNFDPLGFFLYDRVDIELTAPAAPPAPPVVREPSFTG
jgi:hypothetical protein